MQAYIQQKRHQIFMDDTRSIISIEEQDFADEATAEKAKYIEGFRVFMSQWDFEDRPGVLNLGAVPACPEGLELLYYFSVKYPTAYEIARARRYIDPPPAVTRTIGWKAYCDHVAHCYDCREGGAPPIRYDGAAK